MNLVQMLNMTVRPLSAVICEPTKRVGRPKGGQPCKAANEAKREAAIAKYRKAMGTEWLTTQRVESRLGMSRGACLATLESFTKQGLMEQRPVGGAAGFNRRKGWEWRFKDEGK